MGAHGIADNYLHALLDYSGGFYSTAINCGMKASVAADAVQHIERAARELHKMAVHTLPSALEEDIARLIDPNSWRVMDSYLAQMKRKYTKKDIGYDPNSFRDKESLAKARAIIALIEGAGS